VANGTSESGCIGLREGLPAPKRRQVREPVYLPDQSDSFMAYIFMVAAPGQEFLGICRTPPWVHPVRPLAMTYRPSVRDPTLASTLLNAIDVAAELQCLHPPAADRNPAPR
jgi:hypothetical protein